MISRYGQDSRGLSATSARISGQMQQSAAAGKGMIEAGRATQDERNG